MVFSSPEPSRRGSEKYSRNRAIPTTIEAVTMAERVRKDLI
jgi:hypothetical protein